MSAIAAAKKLGGSITGFVAGSGVKGGAAAEAAKIKGPEKILAVENGAYDKVLPFFSMVGVVAGSFGTVMGNQLDEKFSIVLPEKHWNCC